MPQKQVRVLLKLKLFLRMNDLNRLTIQDALTGLKRKKFSSTELVKACLRQIEKVETKIHAFITVCKQEALKQAAQADQLLVSGTTKQKLLGIPISIKDNFCTKDIRTTASSKVLDNFIPPYNATVWQKLKDEGAILIGKTNLDAWAHGSSTETSDYGPTANPWDISCLPGGSSGGAAASVAADEVLAAIGSETAGSIRQPASWCGVVGFKPTYGAVSRYGLIAMGSSFDCPGPITKNVYDAALIFSIISGRDRFDATSFDCLAKDKAVFLEKIKQIKIKVLKIGYSDDYFVGVDAQVRRVAEQVLDLLDKEGAIIKKIRLFPPKYAIAVYTILQRSEVSSNLARYDGIRYGQNRTFFGAEAKRRIMLGTYTLSAGYYDAYYLKAQKVRTLIIKDFQKAFEQVDLIVGPTSPTVALKKGATLNQAMFGELADVLVEPSSIAGLPGLNLPAGMKGNLPVGVQFISRWKNEILLFQVANQLEKIINFPRKRID